MGVDGIRPSLHFFKQERQTLLKMRDRLRHAASHRENPSQSVVRLGVVRLKLESHPIVRLSLINLAPFDQRRRQVNVRLGEIRTKAKGFEKVSLGFLRSPRGDKSLTKVLLNIRRLWLDRRRHLEIGE